MIRTLLIAACVSASLTTGLNAKEVSGQYLETRTCQVYTGPCFANGEVGLAGKDAIMAWSIDEGEHMGVDIAGLKVVMVLATTKTLGFGGIDGAGDLKSLILVDETASQSQRNALTEFAKKHAGRAGKSVVRVESAPISMSLDEATLEGKLAAGKAVKMSTRKARPSDCICSNESAYYRPLTKLQNFAPGVTLEGEFKGRGLGTRWSTPGARSAYMGKFEY